MYIIMCTQLIVKYWVKFSIYIVKTAAAAFNFIFIRLHNSLPSTFGIVAV